MNVQYQRHLALGLTVTLALTGVLLLRQWMPGRAAVASTIPTGASFNLAVARYRGSREAEAVTLNVQAAGLPAFTRTLRRGAWREVVVGPYVSIDEAESAQRLLARRGFGRARMVVDESVRRTPGIDDVALVRVSRRAGPAVPALVMVAAAGRVSVVLELPFEPRHVETRRPEGTVLEVGAGPVHIDIDAQAWNAPDGVNLINQVSIARHDGLSGASLRTRITMPALTQTDVRVVGRRVYIDFWSPDASAGNQPRRPSRPVPVIAEGDEEEEVPEANPAEEYRDAIIPVMTRVGEIEPFLLSAVSAPAPEVLAAVSKTLRSVQGWIRTIDAPKESAPLHASLLEAIEGAAQAVEPGFAGDRAAQARHAIAQLAAYRQRN